MAEKTYAVGEEVTVTGVVTHVGSNGGNPEYTIAVNNPDTERPISVPNPVHPAAFTDGLVELAKANQKTYDEAAKSSADATKEEAEKKDESADTREKTVTPNPAKTPAGNASAVKPTTK